MKLIGTVNQILVILEGLIALYGKDAKVADVIRKRGGKQCR